MAYIFAGINFRGFRGFSANPRDVYRIYLSPAKISSREILKKLTKRPNRHKNKENWPKMSHPRNFIPAKCMFSFINISEIRENLCPRKFIPLR